MIGSKSKHVAIHGDTFAAAAHAQYLFLAVVRALFSLFFKYVLYSKTCICNMRKIKTEVNIAPPVKNSALRLSKVRETSVSIIVLPSYLLMLSVYIKYLTTQTTIHYLLNLSMSIQKLSTLKSQHL